LPEERESGAPNRKSFGTADRQQSREGYCVRCDHETHTRAPVTPLRVSQCARVRERECRGKEQKSAVQSLFRALSFLLLSFLAIPLLGARRGMGRSRCTSAEPSHARRFTSPSILHTSRNAAAGPIRVRTLADLSTLSSPPRPGFPFSLASQFFWFFYKTPSRLLVTTPFRQDGLRELRTGGSRAVCAQARGVQARG
jgi:hypothetical protein